MHLINAGCSKKQIVLIDKATSFGENGGQSGRRVHEWWFF